MTAAAAAGRTEPDESSSEGGAICAAILVIVLAIVGVVHLSIDAAHITRHWQWHHDPVDYGITIAAVTGLDPTKELHAGLLDPAFNLTLRVASPRTAEGRECVKPGTTVEVSYLRSGVPLATGPAPAFCVDVGESREEGSVVAWGDGVRLPELLLHSLAADVLRGSPEFGVKLIPASEDCGSGERFCYDTVDVISCWAKVGGGPAPCTVSKERFSFPPMPRPGVRDLTSSASPPQPPTP